MSKWICIEDVPEISSTVERPSHSYYTGNLVYKKGDVYEECECNDRDILERLTENDLLFHNGQGYCLIDKKYFKKI